MRKGPGMRLMNQTTWNTLAEGERREKGREENYQVERKKNNTPPTGSTRKQTKKTRNEELRRIRINVISSIHPLLLLFILCNSASSILITVSTIAEKASWMNHAFNHQTFSDGTEPADSDSRVSFSLAWSYDQTMSISLRHEFWLLFQVLQYIILYAL